jgi:hypothetical protein
MISVYSNQTDNGLDKTDYETYAPYIMMLQWGRSHPVAFIEKVFDIRLLDYQKYLIEMTWSARFAVWLMTRNGGKSFLVGILIAARSLLFPNQQVQILSKTSRQANETFTQLEKFAKHQYDSVVSNNTVYWDELDIKANGDGFAHDMKNGYSCHVLNGSTVNAVAGTVDSIRGKRSTLSIFDEAGFVPNAVYETAEKFQMQDSEFKTGANYDEGIYPENIPNLTLYIGSASDRNSKYYAKYKEALLHMLMGDPDWFGADISCEIPMNPTMNGEPYHPLFDISKVELAISENEINAMREFYNKFDTFDSNNSVVMMSDIISNTYAYPPQTSWGGKKHKYCICWDPAPKNDNSPVLVSEIYEDEKDHQTRGAFVYMENLIKRYDAHTIRPMTSDEQVQRVREMIYEYNGRDKVPPYDNIMLMIDAGAGGQPYPAIQELMKPWVGKDGVKHPGLYDETDDACKMWQRSIPEATNAVRGHMRIINPRRYRNDLFTAARALIPGGYVIFPIDDPKDDDITCEWGRFVGQTIHLDKAMHESFHQLDLMKMEMVSMVATKSPTTGAITYQLAPEKQNKMHDDRNYVAVMFCWYLQQVREGAQKGVHVNFEKEYIERVMNSNSANPSVAQAAMDGIRDSDDPMAKYLRAVSASLQRGPKQGASPFAGPNPFGKK